LSRYFSPAVAQYLLASDLRPLSQRATVLFSDIRDFTRFCSGRTPDEILGVLNRYYMRMTPVVFRHGGVIDKLLGDGLLAVFGVPHPLPDDAPAALAAAREMVGELSGLNAENRSRGLPPIDIGIGIHRGEVVAGDLGGEQFLDFTIIGSAVNMASRIETANRKLGTRVLLSREVLEALPEPPSLRAREGVSLPGYAEPVILYEVLDCATPPS
jgi:adenylate cyclase